MIDLYYYIEKVKYFVYMRDALELMTHCCVRYYCKKSELD